MEEGEEHLRGTLGWVGGGLGVGVAVLGNGIIGRTMECVCVSV